MGVIKLGEYRFNKQWLKSVTEEYAVRVLKNGGHDMNSIRKAWKIANGKSVPNYVQAEKDAKPKRKRTTKTTKKDKD